LNTALLLSFICFWCFFFLFGIRQKQLGQKKQKNSFPNSAPPKLRTSGDKEKRKRKKKEKIKKSRGCKGL
jgi:hypothetical protein